MIAFFEVANCGSYIFDDAYTFMSDNAPVSNFSNVAFHNMKVSSADSGFQGMQVTLNFTVTAAGSLPFTGSATFSGTDTNPANNSATVVINAK